MKRLLLATGLLTISATAAWANCSVTLSNNPGDSITFTATLKTIDVNEDGEGEPASFSTSGGEANVTIANYFAPQTYTFTASQSNETIVGANVGADSDESCDVTAVKTSKSLKFGFLSQSTRNKLDKASAYLGIAGIGVSSAGMLCTLSLIGTAACGLPLDAVGFSTEAVAHFGILIATDPSDPNFTAIFQPAISALPPVLANGLVTQAEADGFNALINNEAKAIAYGQAVVISFNRAQGAYDAGDDFWKGQQLQAAQQYLWTYVDSLSADINLRMKLADMLSSDPNFSSLSLSSTDILEAEFFLQQGWSPSVLQLSNDLGLDQQTETSIRRFMTVQNVNASAGNLVSKIADPDLLSALKAVVNALEVPVSIAIKPGSGSLTPINSKSPGKIPVAILSTPSFNAVTQVDVTSLTFGRAGTEESLDFCDRSGEDVNGDGLLDLICHFQAKKTELKPGDTIAALRGHTNSNLLISGKANIVVVH